MITITSKDNTITITGHAKYAPNGYDIVCAGISTLVQNLVQSLNELTAEQFNYDMKPGKVHINFKNKNLSKDAQLLLSSFFIGARAIEASYPKHVKIEQAW